MRRIFYGAAIGGIVWWLMNRGGFDNPSAAFVLALYAVWLVTGLWSESVRRMRGRPTAALRVLPPERQQLPRLPRP